MAHMKITDLVRVLIVKVTGGDTYELDAIAGTTKDEPMQLGEAQDVVRTILDEGSSLHGVTLTGDTVTISVRHIVAVEYRASGYASGSF